MNSKIHFKQRSLSWVARQRNKFITCFGAFLAGCKCNTWFCLNLKWMKGTLIRLHGNSWLTECYGNYLTASHMIIEPYCCIPINHSICMTEFQGVIFTGKLHRWYRSTQYTSQSRPTRRFHEYNTITYTCFPSWLI